MRGILRELELREEVEEFDYRLYKFLTIIRVNTHLLASYLLSPPLLEAYHTLGLIKNRKFRDNLKRVISKLLDFKGFKRDTEGRYKALLEEISLLLDMIPQEDSLSTNYIPVNRQLLLGRTLKDDYDYIKEILGRENIICGDSKIHKNFKNYCFFSALVKLRNEFSHTAKYRLKVREAIKALDSTYEKIEKQNYLAMPGDLRLISIYHITTDNGYSYYIYDLTDDFQPYVQRKNIKSKVRLSPNILYVARLTKDIYEILYYINPFLLHYLNKIFFLTGYKKNKSSFFFSPIYQEKVSFDQNDSTFYYVANFFERLERIYNYLENQISLERWKNLIEDYWSYLIDSEMSYLQYILSQKDGDKKSIYKLFDVLDGFSIEDLKLFHNKRSSILPMLNGYVEYLIERRRWRKVINILEISETIKNDILNSVKNGDKVKLILLTGENRIEDKNIFYDIIGLTPNIKTLREMGMIEFQCDQIPANFILKDAWINDNFEILLTDSRGEYILKCDFLKHTCYDIKFYNIFGESGIAGASRNLSCIAILDKNKDLIIFDYKRLDIKWRKQLGKIKSFFDISSDCKLMLLQSHDSIALVQLEKNKTKFMLPIQPKKLKKATFSTDNAGLFLVNRLKRDKNELSYYSITGKGFEKALNVYLNADLEKIMGDATFSVGMTDRDEVIILKNAEQIIKIIPDNAGDINDIDFMGNLFVIASKNSIYIYDKDTLNLIYKFDFESNILKLKLSPSGDFLLVVLGTIGGKINKVKIFKLI